MEMDSRKTFVHVNPKTIVDKWIKWLETLYRASYVGVFNYKISL